MYFFKDFIRSFDIRQLTKFILNILKYECSDNNKKLVTYSDVSGDLGFDAFAPDGIYRSDYLPTFININISTNGRDRMISYYLADIDRTTRFIKSKNDYEKIYNIKMNGRIKLLFITNASEETCLRLKTERPDVELEFWSIDQVVEKGMRYPLEFNALVELAISNNSSSKNVAEFKKYSKDIGLKDKEKQNKLLCDELVDFVKDNPACLVLGTGVSMDYNDELSWDALADRLYDKLPESSKFIDLNKALEVLGKDNFSKAQYSRENLNKNEYASIIHNLLYPHESVYQRADTTLDECANLICKTFNHGRHPFSKVITYNYDNFLEQALDDRSCKYKVLSEKNDYISRYSIPIFHVHGFVPENLKGAELREKIDKLVFTEEDYFKHYSDSSNWMVAVQLETFKDNLCLFVGNSISDFNEKRLLNRTKEKPIPNYAILDSRGLMDSDLAKLHSHFTYGLNVKIIWANGVGEIPNLIRNIASKLTRNDNN